MTKEDEKGPPPTLAVNVGQGFAKPGEGPYGRSDPLPAGLTALLHLEAGPNAPATLPIVKPVTVIGRGESLADVDVGDDSASRRHAFIVYRDGEFLLTDMGSLNGTFVAGEVVGQVALEDGMEFQIGTAIMRFELKRG